MSRYILIQLNNQTFITTTILLITRIVNVSYVVNDTLLVIYFVINVMFLLLFDYVTELC